MKRPQPPQHPSLVPVLTAARGLLAQPGVWIKGHAATSAEGTAVGYWDSRACKFSLDGALFRAGHLQNLPAGPSYDWLQWFISRETRIPLPRWNDALGTTHQAVLYLLNQALEALGQDAIPIYPPEEENEP